MQFLFVSCFRSKIVVKTKSQGVKREPALLQKQKNYSFMPWAKSIGLHFIKAKFLYLLPISICNTNQLLYFIFNF